MLSINENFLKLPPSYLFPRILSRVEEFKAQNPGTAIISLGLGDVTQPLAPAIAEAMSRAAIEMATAAGFHGYGPAHGYPFLREKIALHVYNANGINISPAEIFISDGAKCDIGNTQELLSQDNVVAVCDPVFPLYVDINVMAGRSGPVDESGCYEGIVYLPCTPENNFSPEPPKSGIDLVYLCSPNNPTGAVLDRTSLRKWVSFAHERQMLIIFDAAYEAYITDPDLPRSIYEIEGAKEVAIEIRSFSKTAGFTGLRCAFTVIPDEVCGYDSEGHPHPLNPLWRRRHSTKFNGASYITQVGAAAVYTPAGTKQTRAIIDIYLANARILREGLVSMGYRVYGGVNAPYIWLKTPDGKSSWDFFELLLQQAQLVSTPGAGFGSAGEGFLRLSTFAQPEDVSRALERMQKL